MDLIGKKYGKLTVVAESPKRQQGYICWICSCECGNECVVKGIDLRNRAKQSCGCQIVSMLGRKFGRLTVISEITNRNSKSGYWECLCECGNKCVVKTRSLRNDTRLSCGCNNQGLIGKKYGMLTVVDKSSERRYGCMCWECLCECGKRCVVRGIDLEYRVKRSCGCNKKKSTIRNG